MFIEPTIYFNKISKGNIINALKLILQTMFIEPTMYFNKISKVNIINALRYIFANYDY
jgi:hypothetical protein